MSKHNFFSKTALLPFFEQVFFFFVVFFIPSQLGKHYWPEFSTIFSIRTDYYSPTLYFWDLLLFMLLFFFFLQGKRFKAKGFTIFLIFLLSQIISLFVAENIGAGFVRAYQYLIAGLFGLYISSSPLLLIRKSLFFGLAGGLLYSSCIAILQVLQGKTLGLWILGERNFSLDTLSIATFDWYGQVFLRAYGTFAHPNVLAAYILVAICIFVWISELKVGKTYTRSIWVIVGVGSVALFLTFSRVALLCYGLIFSYFLRNRRQLLVLIFCLLLPFLYVRFHSAFNFDQLSFIRREELAVQSIQLFMQQPVFGVGLNNFVYQLAHGSLVSGESRFLQPVHNVFLLTLAETGIVGFGGLLLLLIFSVKRIVNPINPYFLAIWVFLFILSFFDHYFLSLVQGQRILFLVWGLSMLEYQGEDVKRSV